MASNRTVSAALLFLSSALISAASIVFERPEPNVEDAAMARWLAHTNTYGTLSLLKDGKPYGGIVSYSDGTYASSTGRLFFYLAGMGELPKDAAKNPQASFTVTEAQLGSCPEPEEPTCAKVTFVGKFLPTAGKDQSMVSKAMFDRHPKMESWGAISDHDFTMYEMQIEEIHLLDFFGGIKDIKPADYFVADLKTTSATATNSSQNGNPVGDAPGYGSTAPEVGNVWIGVMAGSLVGAMAGVALVALGAKLCTYKQEKQYSLAACNIPQ